MASGNRQAAALIGAFPAPRALPVYGRPFDRSISPGESPRCFHTRKPISAVSFGAEKIHIAERKSGVFVKVKDGEIFNRRNTLRILRIKI